MKEHKYIAITLEISDELKSMYKSNTLADDMVFDLIDNISEYLHDCWSLKQNEFLIMGASNYADMLSNI